MAKIFKVKGVAQTIKGLQSAQFTWERGVERGLKKAGLLLQRESQKIVPIQWGVLKNSAATRATGSGVNTVVVVVYTASYAIFVHENLEAAHAVGKTAKFLENPLKKLVNDGTLAKIIQDEAQP
jgi:hypothetical protein